MTAGEWTVVGATIALAVASLLTWYTLPGNVVLDAGIHRTFNGWSVGFAPTTLLPLVFGVAIAVPTVLQRVADVDIPERIGGISCTQLRLVLAAAALVLSVAEVATQRRYGPASLGRGPGLWLTVVASIALLVGVVLDHHGSFSVGSRDSAEPNPAENEG